MRNDTEKDVYQHCLLHMQLSSVTSFQFPCACLVATNMSSVIQLVEDNAFL